MYNGPGSEPSKTCLVMTPSVYPFAASKHGARVDIKTHTILLLFLLHRLLLYLL